jgi:hypothetical protein
MKNFCDCRHSLGGDEIADAPENCVRMAPSVERNTVQNNRDEKYLSVSIWV